MWVFLLWSRGWQVTGSWTKGVTPTVLVIVAISVNISYYPSKISITVISLLVWSISACLPWQIYLAGRTIKYSYRTRVPMQTSSGWERQRWSCSNAHAPSRGCSGWQTARWCAPAKVSIFTSTNIFNLTKSSRRRWIVARGCRGSPPPSWTPPMCRSCNPLRKSPAKLSPINNINLNWVRRWKAMTTRETSSHNFDQMSQRSQVSKVKSSRSVKKKGQVMWNNHSYNFRLWQ